METDRSQSLCLACTNYKADSDSDMSNFASLCFFLTTSVSMSQLSLPPLQPVTLFSWPLLHLAALDCSKGFETPLAAM